MHHLIFVSLSPRLLLTDVYYQIKQAIGTLDNVARIVKVVGFVASAEGYTEQPKVSPTPFILLFSFLYSFFFSLPFFFCSSSSPK